MTPAGDRTLLSDPAAPSALDILSRDYPGDDAWTTYAAVFRPVGTDFVSGLVPRG